MLLAKTTEGMRPPGQTGERAACPGCEKRVDAVVGEIVIEHWRHHSARDCDSWAEGETEWHLRWKLSALRSGFTIEVPFREPLHRADAVSPTGIVYEFQHSGLTEPDLAERSFFYEQHGPLIWIFDANGPWTRRWHKWRREGQKFHLGLMVLHESDDQAWIMDADGSSKPIRTWELWSSKYQVLARHNWEERHRRCVTCGASPVFFFADGTGTSRCSHPVVRLALSDSDIPPYKGGKVSLPSPVTH